MTVGIPNSLNFPGSDFGMVTRFTGLGRYVPSNNTRLNSPGWSVMYCRSSSVFIPSTPGAPLLDSTFLRAAFKFEDSSIFSRVMPAKSGEVCAVFSISYDGLCALLTPSFHAVDTQRQIGFLCFLHLETL